MTERNRYNSLKTVLIVDDSELTRSMLKDILVPAGYEVIGQAEDGQLGYEAYKRLKPDFVTMDITMPNVNGIQALRMIREYDKDAIVVMCSAMGEQFMVIEAIKAGAKEFIVKPFTEEEALKAIDKALNGK